MKDLVSSDDYVKAVELASKRIGISSKAFVHILNEGIIGLLIEHAMRVEDATVKCADGRLIPDMTFQKAITMLGTTLDTITNMGLNTLAAVAPDSANDNKTCNVSALCSNED